jgi:hypothetical protein
MCYEQGGGGQMMEIQNKLKEFMLGTWKELHLATLNIRAFVYSL